MVIERSDVRAPRCSVGEQGLTISPFHFSFILFLLGFQLDVILVVIVGITNVGSTSHVYFTESNTCLTSAQVMISQFVGLSPTSGSVLTAQSLEPALDSVSPSLAAPPPLALCLKNK